MSSTPPPVSSEVEETAMDSIAEQSKSTSVPAGHEGPPPHSPDTCNREETPPECSAGDLQSTPPLPDSRERSSPPAALTEVFDEDRRLLLDSER